MPGGSTVYKKDRDNSLSKMSSGNRLRNQQRSALDNYQTQQSFKQSQRNPKNDTRLTIDASPARFNIGQVRAASQIDSSEMHVNPTKKRKERLSPMGPTHYPKYAENNYNSTQRVPVKQRLLPRV